MIISSPYFMGERMVGFDVPEPHSLLDPPLPEGSPQERMAVLYDHLAAAVAGASRPVVYAGDCVSIIGTMGGLQRAGRDATLIFFDAHGDFNTWETTPSEFLGGMPLAMITGRGEQTIVDGAGTRVLDDARVWLVGARDIDPGEDALIAASGITAVSVEQVLDKAVPGGPLHVHVDLDVVDPAEMPAMNYPAPAGPSVATVARAVQHLATGDVAAFSISSWNPALPGADQAATAAQRIAAPFL
jgi:arginase